MLTSSSIDSVLVKNGMRYFLAMIDMKFNFFCFRLARVSMYIFSKFLTNPCVSMHNLQNYFIENSFVIRFITDSLLKKVYSFSFSFYLSFYLSLLL